MTKHKITSLKGYDIAPDGRTVALNFADANDRPVSLEMSTMELERTSYETGFAITKARQLSDISKSGIIPYVRPKEWRASLLNEHSPVVLISFRLQNGLEVHYGIPATAADSLVHQLQDASEQGKKAKGETSH